MDKKRAVKLFGSQVVLARALGCTRQYVSNWPDPIPHRIADRVIAACVRSGIDPSPLLDSETKEAA